MMLAARTMMALFSEPAGTAAPAGSRVLLADWTVVAADSTALAGAVLAWPVMALARSSRCDFMMSNMERPRLAGSLWRDLTASKSGSVISVSLMTALYLAWTSLRRFSVAFCSALVVKKRTVATRKRTTKMTSAVIRPAREPG